MKVIFTCGGTGGHINPAIAVANILKERCPEAEILFVGAKGGMEEELVPKAGYRLVGLPASSFSRKMTPRGICHNVSGAVKIGSALVKVRKLIKAFQPDVIVGTGGYASFPALRMGSKLGVPVCVHEANAVPGMATRMAAKTADRILVNFPESGKAYECRDRVEAVGMPVRREFVFTKREDARRELGLDDRPLVVSAFGSLGAMEMNKAMADFMKCEKDDGFPYQHIHATGSFGWEWMPDLVREKGVDPNAEGIDTREYLYNMPTVMAAADVIISRAGASSCSEIAAAGIPCILIPSPNVTDNHQEKNARVMEERGACRVVLESECSGQRLYEETKDLLEHPEKREEMRQALLRFAVPDSADRICDIIFELAR